MLLRIDSKFLQFCFYITVKDQAGGGSDVEKDATKLTILPPGQIVLPSDSPVVQVSCGLHHTLVMLQNGQVISLAIT